MSAYLILFIGAANILVAAAGGRFSILNLIVGFLCLLKAFGAFGPYED